ncbi:MAG: DUF58 domain-containing protein [Pseudomonadota bacterium]
MAGLNILGRDSLDTVYRLLQKFGPHKAPQTLPITIDRRRVYILPTLFGLFFGLVLLVLLLGALNYNNNMALLFTFLLGALGLLVPIYTVRNLAGLQVVQVSAEPVFAGSDAVFAVTLLNPAGAPRPMVWARAGGPPTFTHLTAQGRADLGIVVPAPKRGWLSLPRSRLHTTFPVGMFYAWSWIEPDTRCLVYPRPEDESPPLPLGHDRGSGHPERSGDEEWSGLRDYQPGDPSRSVAWKILARSEDLVTKTFSDHRSTRLQLSYDQLPELDREQRLARLCRWILEAEKQDLAYELVLPHVSLGPDHGPVHQHQCLQALAEFPT